MSTPELHRKWFKRNATFRVQGRSKGYKKNGRFPSMVYFRNIFLNCFFFLQFNIFCSSKSETLVIASTMNLFAFAVLLLAHIVSAVYARDVQVGPRTVATIGSEWTDQGKQCGSVKFTWTVQGTSACMCAINGWYGEFVVADTTTISANNIDMELVADAEGKHKYRLIPEMWKMFAKDGESYETTMTVCFVPGEGQTTMEDALSLGFLTHLNQKAINPPPASAVCKYLVTVNKNSDSIFQYESELQAEWNGDVEYGTGWYLEIDGPQWPSLTGFNANGGLWNAQVLVSNSFQAPAGYNNIVYNRKLVTVADNMKVKWGIQHSPVDISEMRATLKNYVACGDLECEVIITDNTK